MVASHNRYEVIVLGGGTAAGRAARVCAAAGRSVAMVEDLAYGGTCPLRGCDPKKLLRRGAEIVESASLMRGKGIGYDQSPLMDWEGLVEHKNAYIRSMPEKISASLRDSGIALLHGTASFTGSHSIEIEGDRIEADKFIVATGSMPRPMTQSGAEHMVTSDVLMDIEDLPNRILFVGAGYVSLEFAHMIARSGREVRIVHEGNRVLPAFDGELVADLLERTREAGIDIQLNAPMSSIDRDVEDFVVHTGSGDDSAEWRADLVVHGAGRVPATDRLNLDAAGIETEHGGVAVNAYLQSRSNPDVYAAGDAAASEGIMLTPVASREGEIAARNLLDGNNTGTDYVGVPTAVFTIPPLAMVGLKEAEARSRFDRVRVVDKDTGSWFSSYRVGEHAGRARVILDDAGDRVLGAHLFGEGSDALVNVFAMAIQLGLTTAQMKSLSFAYPTHFSNLASML